jgi:hypothetical protein
MRSNLKLLIVIGNMMPGMMSKMMGNNPMMGMISTMIGRKSKNSEIGDDNSKMPGKVL